MHVVVIPDSDCPACAGTGKQFDHKATGATLSAQRLAKGISMQSMANSLGISAQYLNGLEKGRKRWTTKLATQYNFHLNPPAPDLPSAV